ncbi:hypothetical protein [Microbacterium sp.]|uniref:hypothetical protein n=1 Tax=Microbacterium sp. TaxID=51671 RepID=UPI003A8A2C0C
MTTAPLTPEDLRRLVTEVLDRYGITVAEFVDADVDDLESDELRDLWLMVKGALTVA